MKINHNYNILDFVAILTCHLPDNCDAILFSVCIDPQKNGTDDWDILTYWLDEDIKWNLEINVNCDNSYIYS